MQQARDTHAPRAPAPRRQGERRATTRARLIEAALDVFALAGYEHAGVDDIAAAAGVSKGAFYFHFTTKQDILLELLRIWSVRRTARLTAACHADGGPADRLRETLAALLTYDDFRWPRLLVEFWAEAARSDDVARGLRRTHRRWLTVLGHVIAGAAGGAGAGSVDDAAAAVLALHDGLVCEVALGRKLGA
ncbi:MAG TPA: TetR family transcriptional regulator, partial [Dehalococcoidia bacterium]|nr:TetR family transcriptional regulator [Dehalococcoidia bacterium]